MRALRLIEGQSEPQLVEAPNPMPGPGEVVIDIVGAGACHSDIHLIDLHAIGALPFPLPFTLGHENTGHVAAVGSGVNAVQLGDAVAVYGVWGCGTCARCRRGESNYCAATASGGMPTGGGGLGLDGGMADQLLVPSENHLVKIPSSVEVAAAAPLTDAGLTTYHAINRSLSKLTPSSTLLVIGVGGLGHMAIQIAKAMTAATIIAVDARPSALELAATLGADHTVVAGESAVAQIRSIVGPKGCEVVLDVVGADDTLALGAASVSTLGDLSIVGIAGGAINVSYFSLPLEVSIQTTYYGYRHELVELLDLAARGLVHTEYQTVPLSAGAEAYRAMREGTVRGRTVVVP